MNSDGVYNAIESIAGTTSTKVKQELLTEYAADRYFYELVRLALDPYVTYGIAKLPVPRRHGLSGFTDATLYMLDKLARRELTGNVARERIAAELEDLTAGSGELLTRILTKDLRAGFGATLCNKARAGWIPVFDCMLAHPFNEKRVKAWPVAVEPKLDGFRLLAFADLVTSEVRMLTRSGQEYTCFEHLKPTVLALAQKVRTEFKDEGLVVLDGEAVSGTFAQTASALRKKNVQCSDAVYHVFEVLPGSVFTAGAQSAEYGFRRTIVDRLPEDGPVRRLPVSTAYDEASIHAAYEENRARGLEGVIVKSLTGRYVLKRSYDWMKIKAEETLDLPVVDVFEGTGKFLGKLGGLVVDYEGVRVRVGSGIGAESGVTDSARADIWANPELVLGRMIEVQYHEVTPDGSLRHPRFVRFRDDKVAA